MVLRTFGAVAGLLAALGLPATASALGDTTPPESAASPPAFATGPSFDIPYTASDDAGGSGVARVDLYAKGPGDPAFSVMPVDSDTTPATPSFTYTPTAGDGQYAFYTVAVDNDGNSELPPLTEDGATAVDSTPPSSAASAPGTAGSGSIDVTYTASDGSGTGVDSVELWAKAPGDSAYSLAGTDTSPATPSFSYTPSAGDGMYRFYTIAVDALGNREQAPSQPDARTLRDTTAPTSTASAPGTTGIGSFSVTYTATDGSGTGVDSVELWAKAPGDSGFSKVATDSSPGSPSFSYNPTAGDGTYSFYTVALDALGNREPAPSQPDAQTTRDTDAPGSTASAPAAVGGAAIPVTYIVGGAGIARVELWAKAPGDSGYSLAGTDTTPDSTSFSYNPTAGD